MCIDAPFKCRVTGSGGTAHQTVLNLGKVRLEKVDLMLEISTWGIGGANHDGVMVVNVSRVDGGRGLRDQFGTSHRLAVPERSIVNGELGTLLGDGICGILVARAEVDVLGDLSASVNVVLVWSDLVASRPVVQIGAGGEIVESSIPEDGASQRTGGESLSQSKLGKHLEDQFK